MDDTQSPVSDSGSELGAARRWQVRSGAVIRARKRPLTWGNVEQLGIRCAARSVRIEVRTADMLS